NDDNIVIFPALPAEWTTLSFEDFLATTGALVFANLDADKGTFSVRIESKKEVKFTLHLPEFAKKLVKTNMSNKPSGRSFEVTIPANKAIELQYKYQAR
ncbi:MAG: hypothetical protein K2M64_00400, partial [Clostridia bacterium]|nr:hypothetical protein [Clostridia bacterium]